MSVSDVTCRSSHTFQDLGPEMDSEKQSVGGISSGGAAGTGGEPATTTIKGKRVKDHRYTQHVSLLFCHLHTGHEGSVFNRTTNHRFLGGIVSCTVFTSR